MAGSAGAAVPGATVSSEAWPLTYSDGHAAGFRASYQLDDSSTLSKLFLRIDLRSPISLNTVFSQVTRNGNDVTKSACQADLEDIVCTFKTVRNTDTFAAKVAYDPAGATAVTMAFVWKSVGVPQNGDQSHGDAWDNNEHTATLNNANGNYAGAFTLDGDTSVANAPLGAGNVQAARLVGLPKNVAASVQDGPNAQNHTCIGTTECAGQFGEWVEAFVGDGENFPVWQLQVTYASGTPKAFIHQYGDPLNPTQEPVGTCAKKNPTYPCFTWSANTNTATIFTLHNGSFKGR